MRASSVCVCARVGLCGSLRCGCVHCVHMCMSMGLFIWSPSSQVVMSGRLLAPPTLIPQRIRVSAPPSPACLIQVNTFGLQLPGVSHAQLLPCVLSVPFCVPGYNVPCWAGYVTGQPWSFASQRWGASDPLRIGVCSMQIINGKCAFLVASLGQHCWLPQQVMCNLALHKSLSPFLPCLCLPCVLWHACRT